MTPEKNRVLLYLQENHIAHQLLPTQLDDSLLQMAASANIDSTNLVRAVLLESEQGLLCAVLPAHNVIDFDALKNHTGHNFQPAKLATAQMHFLDCKALVVPPLAFLYDIDVLFDESLINMTSWIIDAGLIKTLVEITKPSQLNDVFENHRHDFSISEDTLAIEATDKSFAIKTYAPEHTSAIDDLYSMPEKPAILKKLSGIDISTESKSLETLLIEHPDYQQCLKEYLIHSVFNIDMTDSKEITPGNLIANLGPRLVTALLRGLVIWSEFPLPADGPLGKQLLFQHACVATQVSYKLVSFAGGIKSVEPPTACAITINQNIGFLLLYWLFKPEYFLFNRMTQANNKLTILDIEKQFLAYGLASQLIKKGHAHAGFLLMDKWQFDDSETIVCLHHHDAEYRGDYEHEVHLLIIVNYLLRHASYGDTANSGYPDKSLKILGLDQSVLTEFCGMMTEYDIALSP